MAPTTRSAAPKSVRENMSNGIQASASPIVKYPERRSSKLPKNTDSKRQDRSAKSLPTEDQVRAAIHPEGTTMGELMEHFRIRPEHRNDMASLLVSMNLLQSVNTAPLAPDGLDGLVKSGFHPAVDNHYQPSPAEIKFGRRDTLFAASPGHVSSAARGLHSSSPRRLIFERIASVRPISTPTKRIQAASPRTSIFGELPSASAASATARVSQTTSPRQSIFGDIPPARGLSPRKAPGAGGLQDNSPRRSDFGRMASVSASSPARLTPSGEFQSFSPRNSIIDGKVPSMSSSPRTPKTPQSPFAVAKSQPAKITVSASTKQEAESVLARQQLVRESLFELRGIITNVNWKVQQFEVLVDKAEKDVIWDTASVETDQGGVKGGKRLRVSFDPIE